MERKKRDEKRREEARRGDRGRASGNFGRAAERMQRVDIINNRKAETHNPTLTSGAKTGSRLSRARRGRRTPLCIEPPANPNVNWNTHLLVTRRCEVHRDAIARLSSLDEWGRHTYRTTPS